VKIAQKVNGISVSEPPKIGERPYPSPFHPVENPPKSGKFHVSTSLKASHTSTHNVSPTDKSNYLAKLTHKTPKNTDHQVLALSLDRGTRTPMKRI